MRIVDGNIWRGKSSEHPNINNSNVTDLPTPPMEGEANHRERTIFRLATLRTSKIIER